MNMDPIITADSQTLYEQAIGTTNDYMRHAVETIDELFGKGYATEHPELVAAYMQTAASDLAASIHGKIAERVMQRLADAVASLSDH